MHSQTLLSGGAVDGQDISSAPASVEIRKTQPSFITACPLALFIRPRAAPQVGPPASLVPGTLVPSMIATLAAISFLQTTEYASQLQTFGDIS